MPLRCLPVALAVLIVASAACAAQQSIRATTQDGRAVELRPDGTWRFADAAAADTAKPHVRAASATKQAKPATGQFSVWFDPAKWRETAPEAGRLSFASVDGTVTAVIVTQEAGLLASDLRALALQTTQNVAPDARLISSERRKVNGRDVLALRLEGTTRAIPFVYLGYFHGGSSGTIQVITFVSRNLLESKQADMEEFLDGLEIADQDLAGDTDSLSAKRSISLSGDRFSVEVDQQKWRIDRPDAAGRITLEHIGGRAFAVISSEVSEAVVENLAETALLTARTGDPRTKLVYRDRRPIGGRDVLVQRIETRRAETPMTIYAAYLSGRGGTIQIVSYTATEQFAGYEADLTELFNGIRAK